MNSPFMVDTGAEPPSPEGPDGEDFGEPELETITEDVDSETDNSSVDAAFSNLRVQPSPPAVRESFAQRRESSAQRRESSAQRRGRQSRNVSLASQDVQNASAPAIVAPGAEWTTGALPALMEARKVFNAKFGKPSAPFDELKPWEAYTSLHNLCRYQPGAEPLKRSASESPDDFALRSAAQRLCTCYILPRAGCESEDQFKLRVQVRKPRAPSAPKKPPALVLPCGPRETPNDFERRMQVQTRTTLTVVPRGVGEDPASFDERIRAVEESIMKWSKLTKRVPPLILPRSKHEDRPLFLERLKHAVSPDACCIILPQTHGESEALARKRLALQKKLKDVAVYPFDRTKESPEDFEERLQEMDPSWFSRRLSSVSARRRHLGVGSPSRGSRGSRGSFLGSSLRKMSSRFSTKVRTTLSSVKRGVGSPKLSFASPKDRSGGSIFRPPSVKQDDDDGATCCCLGTKSKNRA